jgi:hypothetical protein
LIFLFAKDGGGGREAGGGGRGEGDETGYHQ